jgi:hypothetical protein
MKFSVSVTFLALCVFSAPPAQEFNTQPFAPQIFTGSSGSLPQVNSASFFDEPPATSSSQQAGSFNFLGYNAPMYSEDVSARDGNQMSAMSSNWVLQDVNIDRFAI